MVNVRKAIERSYNGLCTVSTYEEYTKPNGSTAHQETTQHVDLPCQLSFSTSDSTDQYGNASDVSQKTKVFLSPDVVIKAGSKLTVTQNGRTTVYSNSGEPAVYNTHQEIALELFDGWA